jgi:hypothetical protein
VVEQEAVNGPIAAVHETRSEAFKVESCYACFLAVTTSDEFDKGSWVVGVEIYDLCFEM